MKAVVLTGPNTWEVSEVPKPKPQKGQVLIKMAYSPINPSDLAFLTGEYGLKKGFPIVPGLEGSGVVESSGGGFVANRLKGKNVACSAPTTGNGTWAEYMVTEATKCVDLSPQVGLDQGAMLFVNPLTALAFSKKAKQHKADLIVFSAAGSALGQMLLYFAKLANIPVLGIVRSDKGKNALANSGYKSVISSESTEYLNEVKDFAKPYKKAIFFDAVGGGSVPYQVLSALPENSHMVTYGRLDRTPAAFEPQLILFNQNTIEGYWLSKEAQKKSIWQILSDVKQVQKMLKSGFETQIQSEINLGNITEGLKQYASQMSAGKVLLKL